MGFLQIASWNIEHLGGQARAQRKQSAFALAEHIEMSGIDVIALQEIYVTPADEEVRIAPGQPVIPSHAQGERRNADLDLVCYLLEEHLDDTTWAYTILPNRNEGDESQLCAVLWNNARVQLDGVTRLAVEHKIDGDSLWDRAPHVLTFKSDIAVYRRDLLEGDWRLLTEGRRFSLVPLHMKSNVGGPTKNERVRAKEATELCRALKALGDALDPSLILIGDTNILTHREPAIATYIDNGFIDLNNNDSTTFWSSQFGESPFDRAFLAAGRDEFKYTRQYVMRSTDLEAHDRLLSDHYMIKISVKDYLDDADPRPPVT